MRNLKILSSIALPLLMGASISTAIAAQNAPKVEVFLSPSKVIEDTAADEWAEISPSDLMVMILEKDAKGRDRRVIIQLLPPPFSQSWVGNMRTLTAARWYDGISVVRVQDNYVTQWGDPNGEEEGQSKKLPDNLNNAGENEYVQKIEDVKINELKLADPYAQNNGFYAGWPMASSGKEIWPTHCYSMVGVGRGLSPDTGTGAELYTVIGHAPRHLDRNIALVGRIISGMEHLSSLPRGTGPLGFYETPEERTKILSVRMGDEVADLSQYEYLSTDSASFAKYAKARQNRHDQFFIRPAGGADICNISVPIRVKK
ncbi:peptidylprolyl isomerase [Sphingorhabdus lutea]|uniref:Peptidylprolyl isomerase n=2 Tax=Sphingorhabdus lutea TaxID=1913578 RepID=A0A1L3JA10_9SPHN|nr:peptidylprolyl isomerase [Sphingorhabdus lutea]APG61970.1 peptidylprolyl isomerase [Sphingorhabdus lutea]